MPIFPSGHSGAWRTPDDSSSALVAARATGDAHELTIRPGADIGDLLAVLASLPADAFFTDHFGDVDAVLMFQRVPGDPAPIPAGGGNPSTGPAAASVSRP